MRTTEQQQLNKHQQQQAHHHQQTQRRQQQENKEDDPTTTDKPKRKINRSLATCTGCRKRKTRCDRGRPCSECFKRNLDCDYSGAISPPIIMHRKQNEEIERDQYVKELEARLRELEQNVSTQNNPIPTPFQEEKLDFSVDDLAADLSSITIGQRVRCKSRSAQPHPLRAQVEHIISSRSTIPRTTFIQPDQQFSLNLVATSPIPSLKELCTHCLPDRPDCEFLSEYFFNSINLWSSCLNRDDWKIQFGSFWNTPDRLQFRPSPSNPAPLHLTQHYLTQFLSTIYSVLAHGLLALADIHHLDPAPDNQSSSDSSTSSPPQHGSLWSLGQAEKISLANQWFSYSLGLLFSPGGDIYVKPTVFGVRAMSILSNVELAPENTDHGIFFWTLTCNLAASAGLLREPPIADEEVLETLDETEIESRRCLAWHTLSIDWAGHSISGGIRPHSDPDQFSVKMPGTVPSPAIPLHPVDGWPLDPLICVKRICAINDRLMQKANNNINSGQLATYQDVLEIQRQYDEMEASIPPRLQSKLSADGKSLEPVVKNNQIPFLILAFLRTRLCIARVRLNRLFIFPKKGVPLEERCRQIELLLHVSKIHFLGVQQFSHTLNMHPLLIYSLVNTAVACALVLLINRQTQGLVIDENFFLAELNKVIDLFNMGKKTMAATMASKAVSLLQNLVRLVESKVNLAVYKSLDGRKKGAGTTLLASQNQQSDNAEDEGRKRKKQTANSTPMSFTQPSSQPLSYEIGIVSQNLPRPEQQIRHEVGFNPNQFIRSSNSLTSSAVVSLTHSNSASTIQHPGSQPLDTFGSQSTPPLVSPHPLRRNALSNSSSSSRLSPHHYRTPDQLNSSQIRRVARLPQNLDEVFNVEFGSMDSKLAHHTFDFSTYAPFSGGENDGQLGRIDYGEGTVGDNSKFSDLFGHDLSFQFQPTAGEETYSIRTRDQDAPVDGGLEAFQPTFTF